MPNWCDNTIQISGPTNDLNDFINGIGMTDNPHEMLMLSNVFSVYAPIGDWEYSKAVSNWSTKWDIDMEIYDVSHNEKNGISVLDGRFDSAWAPATQAWATIATKFPMLDFIITFIEPGMGFYGCDCYVGGSHVLEHSDDIPNFPIVDDNYDQQWDDVRNFFDTYTDSIRKEMAASKIVSVRKIGATVIVGATVIGG